jgi:hypothetical protein
MAEWIIAESIIAEWIMAEWIMAEWILRHNHISRQTVISDRGCVSRKQMFLLSDKCKQKFHQNNFLTGRFLSDFFQDACPCSGRPPYSSPVLLIANQVQEASCARKNSTYFMHRFDTNQTPEGYISKDIIVYPYIPKSPKKDIHISYHSLEQDILGI